MPTSIARHARLASPIPFEERADARVWIGSDHELRNMATRLYADRISGNFAQAPAGLKNDCRIP
ncbi:MAG: hypothetical protein ACYCY3_07800 [Halothiobacillus sp.]